MLEIINSRVVVPISSGRVNPRAIGVMRQHNTILNKLELPLQNHKLFYRLIFILFPALFNGMTVFVRFFHSV